MIELLLIIIGLRLLKFSWDAWRSRSIPCPDMSIKSLDKVTEILDRQVERLEGMEKEIMDYDKKTGSELRIQSLFSPEFVVSGYTIKGLQRSKGLQ